MQHYTVSSQHLENNGSQDNFFLPLNQDNFFNSPEQPQQPNSFSFTNPELSEKRLELLKRLLLLQKKKHLLGMGDESFLLDENFELSPSNYSHLLECTKTTAKKLNDLMTQSSQLFSNYLNGFKKPEVNETEEPLNYMQSPSVETNSTRDSDQFSDIQMPSDNPTPRNSGKAHVKINKAWDSEKDKLLLKLVCKYNKDWKKVYEGLSNVYQTKYKIDFLRERYRQLYYSNQKLNKYTLKSNQKEVESFDTFDNEGYQKAPYQFAKKAPNGFKQKQRVDATRKNLLENLISQTESTEPESQTNFFEEKEKESVQFFFTKENHTEFKTIEMPWMNFDFDAEFGGQSELFERITPCFN